MLCKCLKGCSSPQTVHIQEGYEILETHQGSALNSVHPGKEVEECAVSLTGYPTDSVLTPHLCFRLRLGISASSRYRAINKES